MNRFPRLLPLLGLLLLTTPLMAVEVEVTIENLAPENGTFLTPVWIGFHDGTFDSYDGGAPLRGTIERIAEDGNTGPLTDEFDALFGTTQATILGPGGPIAPGETARGRFNLDGNNPAVRYFSYVSMVIPSNDAFIANGSPVAHRVFDTDGSLTPFSFIVRGNGGVNDGGTEVNTEAPADTAFFGQATPDTGIDENGVVTTHPGFLARGSGGILDDARFAGGQLVTPGREIARITVRPVRALQTRFSGSGAQEVPSVDTEATAACRAQLTRNGNSLSFYCEHDVANAVAAHIHQGDAGVNGPVLFAFDNPASPIVQTFDASAADVASLLAGGLYLNVHSPTFPDGEVRAQIDSCFSGPESVCLNDERFQVSATFETSDRNGVARGAELTPEAGVFTFFDENNVELDVKVLDGCANNGNYWVFAAGLTDQGVVLTVEDTVSGQVQTYTNPLGRAFEPILDTGAFATCP